MKIIKKLDILSLAKIMGLLHGGIYLVAGLAINLSVLIFGLEGLDLLGFGSSILATLLVALLVGALSFALGAVFAWLYNLAAKIVGGVAWEEVVLAPNYQKKSDQDLPSLFKPKPQDEIEHILQNNSSDSQNQDNRETFTS